MAGKQNTRGLSARKQRILDLMKVGARLTREWDVWTGYEYTLQTPGFGRTKVHHDTIESMARAGLINTGPEIRIYSGHHRAVYSLSTESTASADPQGR